MARRLPGQRGVRVANWANTFAATPGVVFDPATEADIVDVLLQAKQMNANVRVLGAAHSPSDIAFTGFDGFMIRLDRYARVLNVRPPPSPRRRDRTAPDSVPLSTRRSTPRHRRSAPRPGCGCMTCTRPWRSTASPSATSGPSQSRPSAASSPPAPTAPASGSASSPPTYALCLPPARSHRELKGSLASFPNAAPCTGR